MIMDYPQGSVASPLLAAKRLFLYLCLTLPLLPVQALAVLFKSRLAKDIPLHYHRLTCRLLGLKVECRGRPARKHPVLFVCNHVSYWDIIVLGGLLRASFIAKAEIAGWPFFSWLAKLQRSVFIDRRARLAGSHRDEMLRRFEADDDLILFPEGTSGDGNRVLPFKSALFAVAEKRPHDRPLTVQPVSIAYTRLDGMPMGRFWRPHFAWFGDMDLPSHAWEGLGIGRVTVVVEFHPPVTIDQFGSRKALAEHCHREVQSGLVSALTGRPRGRRGAAAARRQPAAAA